MDNNTYWFFSVCDLFDLYSCTAFMTSGIPTLAFAEYALESGAEDSQQKSDIEIKIEVVLESWTTS